MRSFWIAIGVLGIVAAVLMWRSSKASSNASTSSAAQVASEAIVDPVQPAAVTRRTSGESTTQQPTAIAPTSEATGGALRAPAAANAAIPSPDADASTEAPDEQALADELMASSEEANDADISEALDENNNDEGAAAAAVEGQLIDGKHILSGTGTADDPFEITWDLLVLASQTYQPREGLTDIPPQVAAVNGKHIRIAGYFAVPMASTDPKEVLFMLNMWDGCCIGVPPSPYDAIEVRLKEPLDGRKQFLNYATLSGTLKVDPFVQNGWLLGMYLMDDGALEIDL